MGHLQCGDEHCAEVWLVEAREYGSRLVRHKECVHIVFIAVQCLVFGEELQFNLVGAFLHQFHRHDNVLIIVGHLHRNPLLFAFCILNINVACAIK